MIPRQWELGLCRYDGWSDDGAEMEFEGFLAHCRDHKVTDLIVLSGDVHFPSVIKYDVFRTGNTTFYELGIGPLSALPLGPGKIDDHFNPTVLYAEGKFAGTNHVFGKIVGNEEGVLTYQVVEKAGTVLFEIQLMPGQLVQ